MTSKCQLLLKWTHGAKTLLLVSTSKFLGDVGVKVTYNCHTVSLNRILRGRSGLARNIIIVYIIVVKM